MTKKELRCAVDELRFLLGQGQESLYRATQKIRWVNIAERLQDNKEQHVKRALSELRGADEITTTCRKLLEKILEEDIVDD